MNPLSTKATQQDTKHDNLIALGCGIVFAALCIAFLI